MQISKWIVVFCFLFSCRFAEKNDKSIKSPDGYDLSKSEKISLPEELDEISGIVYDEGSGTIVSLNDEEGVLYRFKPDSPRQFIDSRFHKGADFEDLLSVGPYWYALKSNGHLFKISDAFTDNVQSKGFPFNQKGKHEFEAMLYDSSLNRIYIFCKICGKTPSVSPEAFSFDLGTEQFDSTSTLTIQLTREQKKELKDNQQVQISAAAIHPQTGDWWFVASASGLLLITDHQGNCKELIPLNRKKFKQPEGLTFNSAADLFISNEAKTGIANILIFRKKS
ncbi:SdiA-regulated domain-containing protein [Pollutibacter soli]|uniref:SdiA-regulated domain-containing protein n=1 Tax=Pollutibacter soli TaxID=3034157 RepID=UPI003013CD8E